MAEIRMPELPDGYYWLVHSESEWDFGCKRRIGVRIDLRKKRTVFPDQRVGKRWSSTDNFTGCSPEENAAWVAELAAQLVKQYLPAPEVPIDVNGLRGAILGDGIKGEYPNG